MKNFLRRVQIFTIKAYNSLFSVVAVTVFSNIFCAFNFKKINKCFDYNEKCYILGNGPSVKKILENHLIRLTRENLFVVNMFCESEYYIILKPKNYIILDNGFWEKTDEMRVLNIQNSFINSMLNVSWSMNLFLPYDSKSFFNKMLKRNNNLHIIYYNRTPLDGFFSVSYSLFKFKLGMPKPHNVLISAISVAMWFNIKQINLLGVEHSWIKDIFIDENNRICSFQNHHYDKRKEIYEMANGALSIGLRSFADTLDSYSVLQKISEKIDVNIVNMTECSYIDSFRKEKFI